MKWIKFSDMKPPVGMYIFVASNNALKKIREEDLQCPYGADIGFIQWDKTSNDFGSGVVIDMYSDIQQYDRETDYLYCWAPVSFFKEHLPVDDLRKEDDWYLHNKNHPNLKKIKEITEELSKMTYPQANNMENILIKTRELSDLFDDINGFE